MVTMRFGSSGQWAAEIDDTPDPRLPLIVLLHGLGGTLVDMTSPLASRGMFAFTPFTQWNRSTNLGAHPVPPLLPVAGFFLDSPATALTGWRTAINAAGFSTAAYSQTGGLLANDVAQLKALATGPLSTDARWSGLRIVFVAHSRGGLVSRNFLTSARTDPALGSFLPRVAACITLHTPNQGSTLPNLASVIDGLLSTVQAVVSTIPLATGTAGLVPPAALAAPIVALRRMVTNPAQAELRIGSPSIARVEASEPVPGVAYHTFGGTRTAIANVMAEVYTPPSYLPLSLPIFVHTTQPALVCSPPDVVSMVPLTLLVPDPHIVSLVASCAALATAAPELAPGVGDLLVQASSAHLPFAATQVNNSLNHAEALRSPQLQGQVLGILQTFRPSAPPVVRHTAHAWISPHPAKAYPARHIVRVTDVATGAQVSQGTVIITDLQGRLLLQTTPNTPFTLGFAPRTGHRIENGRRTQVLLYPTVSVHLGAPYNVKISVDVGLRGA